MATVALPIALQSLIGSSLNLVDNLMVGSLGEAELLAVGVGVQMYFIHWMILFGFTSGSATFMAQFFGAKDMASLRKTTGFAITVALSVSAVFFLISIFFAEYVMRIFTKFPEVIELGAGYIRTGAPCFLLVAISIPLTAALRTTQQTKYPMYASITAFVLNTFLNYIFIFGNLGAPKLGLVGAALATVISRSVELLLILFFIFAMKNKVAGKVREFFNYNRKFALRIVKNALPATANESLWAMGFSLYLAAFGRIGVTEGAAIQACNAIQNLFIMAAFSIGDATLILVGQKLGEGKLDHAYRMAKVFLKVAIVAGLVCGLLLIICGKLLLGLFSFTPRGETLAFFILIVYGATMWLSIFNGTCIVGVLRSGGDTKYPMIVEALTIWCIGVPAAFLSALVFQWPVYLAVLATKSEEMVKAIVMIRRFISKKWVNNVVDDMKKLT